MLTDLVGADVMRLLNEESLARPRPVRNRAGQWRRDPSPEWDWYYYLPESDRSYVARNLCTPNGAAPDDLATVTGYCDVNTWADALVTAIRAARDRSTRSVDPLADDYGDDDADPYELVGPDEVAAMLNVTRNALAQWRCREWTHFPAPDMVLSKMPIWERHSITEWAALTGRTPA